MKDKMDITDDDIAKMKAGTWVPKVKRLSEDAGYDDLLKHHERETKLLMEVIQALARKMPISCDQCRDTGVIETGNNDLPCESCVAGRDAKFSGGRTGAGVLLDYNAPGNKREPPTWGPKPWTTTWE